MKGNIAIIPARGGSKRIPGKNIKDFLGKPIIAYSIEAAYKSKLFDVIMVSTDDLSIAEEAIKYGAVVPFIRSNKNADDFATTTDVLAEVLETYRQQKTEFKYACCLYPCAPFITEGILTMAFNKLREENFNCVMPVLPFSFPIWRSVTIGNNQKLNIIWPENMPKRSQDLDKAFHDAGQFYFFDVVHFLKVRDLWNGNIGGIELDEMGAQDIDTITDWKIAELKYKLLKDESHA